MIDGFIGACPFCKSRRLRQLKNNLGGSAPSHALDGEEVGGAASSCNNGDLAVEPATTMGSSDSDGAGNDADQEGDSLHSAYA